MIKIMEEEKRMRRRWGEINIVERGDSRMRREIIKLWRRENNKNCEGGGGKRMMSGWGKINMVKREGIHEWGRKIIKLWRRRREIKMKRERGR